MVLPSIVTFLKIIGFIILSWILVHFFAAFGIFVAFGYPLWWFFYPKFTYCFVCRTKKEGQFCPLCRQIKTSEEGVYPKNFRSVFLNALLILAFSLLSLGIVFVEGRVFYDLGFPPTPKTVSFIIPSKGQYKLGEIFPMKIEITGITKPVNAVQADVTFDASRLEVVDISTDQSFANIFIQKELNNDVGFARLSGGLPNPGFFAEKGVFGTIFFKGKMAGLVEVSFLPSSLVLANDGRGSNVLKDLAKASYLILPEQISEEERDLQESMFLTQVLGAKSDKGEVQMKFFKEEEGLVLGAQNQPVLQAKKGVIFWHAILNFNEIIVRGILTLWGKILHLK
ncbi:hypothetical protein FJZ41_01200 [Candidatus Shapirobacteria bacterium]|nr:hypothetical protein [Candidatus Shapirobacteria bacterium]